MAPGEAPIAETSTVDALLARRWSHRQPLPTGLLALLTVLFWGVWLYLVLPLVSLLLWAFGVRFFVEQIRQDGYAGLLSSLIAYSAVLLVIAGLLALWIAWNVVRYGGSSERRTARRAEVSDVAVQEAFRLDEGLLSMLRDRRLVRADLDGDGCVVLIADTPPADAPPRVAGLEAAVDSADRPGAQRDRDSTRSG
jgi:poly-beta-1,6-N-acetyl-D-glucosamine biosynthesis protein PgaD